MARLLVTGGAGFIGANFVLGRLAAGADERVVVLDALTYAGHRESLEAAEADARYRFVHADIRDTDRVRALLREERLDTVVHLAAESHVDRSILGPEAFLEVNARGTLSLLEAARSVWLERGAEIAHRFHHVSTDEVYGSLGPDDPPFHEETPYRPNSPYAASKAAADHLVRAYHRTYGLQTTISNCSNNYGPFQFPEKLVPLCLVNLLAGRELPIYGDGSNVRDWLHVHDHCAGIARVLERGRPGETYNLGGDAERTNLELVRALCRTVERLFEERPGLADAYPDAPPPRGEPCESRIAFVADRPGHDRRYAVDASRARRELGYRPAYSLRRGLEETVRWYLDHAGWCAAVTGREWHEWVARQYG